MRMVDGLWSVGYFVIMDNFFFSIDLFKELLSWSICACGTVRFGRVGLLMDLSNTKAFKNLAQGTSLWRMHDLTKVAFIVRMDKKPVLLITIYAVPIQALCCSQVVLIQWQNDAM